MILRVRIFMDAVGKPLGSNFLENLNFHFLFPRKNSSDFLLAFLACCSPFFLFLVCLCCVIHGISMESM